MMSTSIFRAHFDGKVIIPEEPVQLPIGSSLELTVRPIEPRFATEGALSIEQRQAAFDALIARANANPAPMIPDEALRRVNIYERQDGE